MDILDEIATKHWSHYHILSIKHGNYMRGVVLGYIEAIYKAGYKLVPLDSKDHYKKVKTMELATLLENHNE